LDYGNLEQRIHEHDIATYDIVTALHPFYRYKLYQKVADNCHLSMDCDEQELALNVIKMLPRLKKSVVDTFELVSLSYAELQEHQRIEKKRLLRKADKAHINIRRLLAISIDDDIVQQVFNKNKHNRYKHIKIGDKSAQDSIDKKVKCNRARD